MQIGTMTACLNGQDLVVSILLAHPDIDPNLKEKDGDTPFMTASRNGNTSCVRLLLQDQRVRVNESDEDGSTPLRDAASRGHQDVIKLWIASGREMNLGKPEDVYTTDAIGVAKQEKETEVVSLLERFKSDPAKTRIQVRLELGITTGQSIHLLISLSILSSFHFWDFDFTFFFFFFLFLIYFRFPCDHSTEDHPGAVYEPGHLV